MSENKTNSSNVLRLTDITMQFGGVVAINNLSLDVNQGEIVALIGPTAPARRRPSTVSPACTSPPTAWCISMASPSW